jgi:osmotically-inducible protein OsmY
LASSDLLRLDECAIVRFSSKDQRRDAMKRATIALLLALLIAASAFAVQNQNKNAPAKKGKKAAAVDCSKVDDATITANVKEKLSQAPSLKEATINVETKGGVVTLSGTVKNPGHKGVATRIAKRVDCVKSVNNQLTAEKPSPPRGNKNAGKKTGKKNANT